MPVDDETFDIFVSYAREDEERVHPLVSALEAEGRTVFWDRKLLAGQDFRRYIAKLIDTSAAVVVVWSRHSIDSSFVISEAARADRRGVLVPVLIDVVEVPMGLDQSHAVSLALWHGPPQCLPRNLSNPIEKLCAKAVGRQQAIVTRNEELTGVIERPIALKVNPQEEQYAPPIEVTQIPVKSKVSSLINAAQNSGAERAHFAIGHFGALLIIAALVVAVSLLIEGRDPLPSVAAGLFVIGGLISTYVCRWYPGFGGTSLKIVLVAMVANPVGVFLAGWACLECLTERWLCAFVLVATGAFYAMALTAALAGLEWRRHKRRQVTASSPAP